MIKKSTFRWSFNQKMIKINRNRSILLKISWNFNQNRDRRYDLVVEIRIGPKSKIESGFQIGIEDDDLIWEG